MYIYKVIKEREKTINKIKPELSKFKLKNELYKKINKRIINAKKEQILNKYLSLLMEDGDIFALSRKLKGINILQLDKILKENITKTKLLITNIDATDPELTDKKIKELEEKNIEDEQLLNEKIKTLTQYSEDIKQNFRDIFKKGNIINNQMDIIKIKNKKLNIFNRVERKQKQAILNYYENIKESKMLSDEPYNLYKEYKEYENIKFFLEKTNKKIFESKKSLVQYNKELTYINSYKIELSKYDSEEKLKQKTITDFISNSTENESLDYYINNLNDQYTNKDLFIEYFKLIQLEKFNRKNNEKIEQIELHLEKMILFFEYILKTIKPLKEKESKYPIFSNIGYFENTTYIVLKECLNMKKNILNFETLSDNYNDFIFERKDEYKIYYKISKKEIETKLRSIKDDFEEGNLNSIFEKKELLKLKEEINKIKNKN